LKIVIPVEAQRVLEKTQDLVELMATTAKDEKEGKIRKATKILRMLQVSHKASMLSWVYTSTEALDETKSILLRLWQFLLENIRVRHYALRNIFYELLFYLVKRAELSDLPLLGFDSINTLHTAPPPCAAPPVPQPRESPAEKDQISPSPTSATAAAATTRTLSSSSSSSSLMFSRKPQHHPPPQHPACMNPFQKKDLEFGFKLRSMLVETKYCVLQAVSVRGVMNNNFMFFVARMLSVLCFRLPSFGVELYSLWAESYIEPVAELTAEFEMNAGMIFKIYRE
jgi:hypothetical protein